MIRKATKKDIQKIAKLMLEEFKKPPFKEKTSINAVLKSLNFYLKIGKAFVAQNKRGIIGVVVFKVEQWWEGPVIIVEDLAVKNEFKKQGIGKELMAMVEAYAKKNRVKAIHFSTHKKSSTVNFYKKYGYAVNRNIVFVEKKV